MVFVNQGKVYEIYARAVSHVSMVGFVILATHIIEIFVFAGRIKAAAGSALHHMAMIMLFGVFHARDLPKPQ